MPEYFRLRWTNKLHENTAVEVINHRPLREDYVTSALLKMLYSVDVVMNSVRTSSSCYS
jgi:hypothetical protein